MFFGERFLRLSLVFPACTGMIAGVTGPVKVTPRAPVRTGMVHSAGLTFMMFMMLTMLTMLAPH